MATILKIEVILGTLIIFISFIISFRARNVQSSNKHLRFFFIYPFIALCLSFLTITNYFIYKFDRSFTNIFENYFFILENIFWGYFFITFFSEKKFKLVAVVILLLSTSIIASILIYNKFSNFNYKVVSFTNLSFSCYCLLFFIRLFKTALVIIIYSDSTFWIVTGLFFYSVCSLPLYPIIDYSNFFQKLLIYKTIIAVINFMIILMHIFFIKGVICLIRQPKIY